MSTDHIDQYERRPYWWAPGGPPVPALSLPPPRLLAVFAIVALFLWMQSSPSSHRYSTTTTTDHPVKAPAAQRFDVGLRLLMLAVPVLLLLTARYTLVTRGTRAVRAQVAESGTSPWWVAFLLMLLLVLVLYQPGRV